LIDFKSFKHRLLNLDVKNFDSLALDVFQWQASHNPIYQKYLSYLNISPDNVKNLAEIPFLPISFFKNHEIKCGKWEHELVFESSGTTGQERSKHFVKDLSFYHKVSENIFEKQYGSLKDFVILALLPSYLERGNSSLVYMVEHFMQLADSESGFYLNDLSTLKEKLADLKSLGKKILLIGVSFALLDFAEKYRGSLEGVIVMETGGMKGRRKEMIRSDLHKILTDAFEVDKIHSEYGMTELLSQAYSHGDGLFTTPPWMKVVLRDLNDPFDLGKRSIGGINVIDLANIYSCSFIETQDMGTMNKNGTFEVLGRIDNSEIRGCNLLVTSY